MDIKQDVFPSGVPFSYTNLTGADQNTLSKKSKNPNDQFNKMLTDCTISIGIWTKEAGQIKRDRIEKLLSNDRKYLLFKLRQFSLDYQKEFKFSYEWPLRNGNVEKQEYSANIEAQNFPVTPYLWVREEVERIKLANKDLPESDRKPIPDGHTVDFPIMYQDYNEMLSNQLIVKGQFKKSGAPYQFELLHGEIEKIYSQILSDEDNIVVNQMISMRRPKLILPMKDSEPTLTEFDPGLRSAHIIDVEQIRGHIKDVEGSMRTSIVIEKESDKTVNKRVDLVSLVDFFFPSQAL